MKITRNIFIILYAILLVINDPQVARAHTIEGIGISQAGIIENKPVYVDPYEETGQKAYHITYILNGGENSISNREVYHEKELPVTLDVPVKEGYNFAGWYTDSSYTKKVTEITKKSPSELVLFAKWTKTIDSYLNVEMYSYHTGNLLAMNQKELRQCSYNFMDELSIPGMPSTREKDYVNNYINTADYLVTLGMKKDSHLGGVAFDGENLWVCHSNSNTLERISYEYIRLIAEDAPGYCIDASAISDEYYLRNTPSCITCYGGRIWVATYNKMFRSKMYAYTYDTQLDKLVALSNYNIPCKVQGIAFDSQGAVYLSTSLGRSNSSYLKVYSSLIALNQSPSTPSVKVEMPPCSEEIAIVDNNLYVLFESASSKYFEGTDGKGTSVAPIDKVLKVNVATIW